MTTLKIYCSDKKLKKSWPIIMMSSKSSVVVTRSSEQMWNAVIKQALIAGYLDKDVDNYGVLKVTKEGKKFLKKPTSFMVTEDRNYEDEEGRG